jgi:hypothetical protein
MAWIGKRRKSREQVTGDREQAEVETPRRGVLAKETFQRNVFTQVGGEDAAATG